MNKIVFLPIFTFFSFSIHAETINKTYDYTAGSHKGFIELNIDTANYSCSGQVQYGFHGGNGSLINEQFPVSDCTLSTGPNQTLLLEWKRLDKYQVFRASLNQSRDNFSGTFTNENYTSNFYTMPHFGNEIKPK